ncbi:hypothetical protein Neosp_013765 [[Neocosmospora] mangrovei]
MLLHCLSVCLSGTLPDRTVAPAGDTTSGEAPPVAPSGRPKSRPQCGHCGKHGHASDACWHRREFLPTLHQTWDDANHVIAGLIRVVAGGSQMLPPGTILDVGMGGPTSGGIAKKKKKKRKPKKGGNNQKVADATEEAVAAIVAQGLAHS